MDYYLATIMGWGPNWSPLNWTFCQGQTLSISTYTAIFSLIGTIYGGDGRVSFKLPDLRGRAPVGAGQGPGTSYYPQGAFWGTENQVLTVLELPVHNHSASAAELQVDIAASSADAGSATPQNGNVLSKTVDASNFGDIQIYGTGVADVVLAGGSVSGSPVIGNTGGNQSFSIVQPVSVIQFIFCMEGIYPSRN